MRSAPLFPRWLGKKEGPQFMGSTPELTWVVAFWQPPFKMELFSYFTNAGPMAGPSAKMRHKVAPGSKGAMVLTFPPEYPIVEGFLNRKLRPGFTQVISVEGRGARNWLGLLMLGKRPKNVRLFWGHLEQCVHEIP